MLTEKNITYQIKVHARCMFDEILQSNNNMRIFNMPFRMFMLILSNAAKRAAELGDEEMIGYFCRLSIYAFSDPECKEEYNHSETKKYIDKTK